MHPVGTTGAGLRGRSVYGCGGSLSTTIEHHLNRQLKTDSADYRSALVDWLPWGRQQFLKGRPRPKAHRLLVLTTVRRRTTHEVEVHLAALWGTTAPCQDGEGHMCFTQSGSNNTCESMSSIEPLIRGSTRLEAFRPASQVSRGSSGPTGVGGRSGPMAFLAGNSSVNTALQRCRSRCGEPFTERSLAPRRLSKHGEPTANFMSFLFSRTTPRVAG